MHVCEDCGGAMATVFQDALKGPMDYDIELITTGVILSMYEDSLENRKQAVRENLVLESGFGRFFHLCGIWTKFRS